MRSTMFVPLLLLVCSAFGQDCHIYNSVLGPFPYAQVGYQSHSTGDHIFANETGGSCTYTGSSACNAVAQATSFSFVTDSGKLVYPGYVHETASNDAGGTATATFPSVAATSSEGAGGVRECFLGCSFGVTISSAGGSVNFSGGAPKWQAKHVYTNSCPAVFIPVCGGKNAPCPGCGPDGCGPSPILIDTQNQGWHFTDPNTPAGYVTFRFGSQLKKVSWPDSHFENAWLVYDKDGVIDGADDLFGNYTAHADGGVKGHPNPNGFLALAWYDKPSQGGNLDLILDRKDAIWSKLRLWKPKHCHLHPDQPCIALDSELYKLDELGVHSLSLVYQGSGETDKFGNLCSFKALVNPDAGETQKSRDGRWACDFNLAERK